MKTFKRVVVAFWLAIPVNLLLSIISRWYSRHVPYQIEGLTMLMTLLLTAVYKIAKIYRAGMSRSPGEN